LEGLTKSAAIQGAEHGVRVNAVAPGPIDTGMIDRFAGTSERKAALIGTVPVHRLGTATEIAESISFLASDKAAFITGATLAADGGLAAL
jgi:NAD(P)-dependent dehydrogenase (short-subunit alcohol dehydrogenase family)